MISKSDKCLWYFVAVLTCGALREVTALTCFECTESEPNSCGERFDGSNVATTDCRASIYTIDASNNESQVFACLFIKETDAMSNESKFTRRCGAKNLNDTCENIVAKNQAMVPKVRTTCRQCEKEFCNSSEQLRTSFSVVLVLICFAVFGI